MGDDMLVQESPMLDLETLRPFFAHTDWSNLRLLDAAEPLNDQQLDQDLQLGPGSLRKILLHTYNGEIVWLKRWQGMIEMAWPGENETPTVEDLRSIFGANAGSRNRWMDTLTPDALGKVQKYRDSKGTLYQATLGDMMIQAIMHSKHHQAQAANAIKRLGGKPPELDYMYRVRKSA
jgi:uncharacterized damage-inducible protein DinB